MSGNPKRGMGPFTGGQLTTMVCVIVVAVAFPMGAWAVSGSNTFITDAQSGARATVSKSGALTVAGTVITSAAPLKSLYHGFQAVSEGAYSSVASAPAGKTLVITSLNLDEVATTGTLNDTFFALDATSSTCSGSLPQIAIVTQPVVGWTSVSIPSGLVIPVHGALCAFSSTNTRAAIFGYTL
jgi:hypothetical protein